MYKKEDTNFILFNLSSYICMNNWNFIDIRTDLVFDFKNFYEN